MSFKQTLLAASLVAASVSASAAVIQGNSLQSGLDNLTQGGAFFDVNTSQHNPDELWQVGASGASVNTLIFEIAGYANVAEFGIYDPTDITKKVSIFQGADCGQTVCAPAFGVNVEFLGNISGTTFSSVFTGDSEVFASNTYGYYLDSGAGIFYSQKSLNGGDDHMVAFEGDGVTKMDLTGGTNYATFGQNEFILAWEDLPFSNSDFDYSDFVVLVESVSPVSEPTTLALLGLGLAGLGFARRKQAKA